MIISLPIIDCFKNIFEPYPAPRANSGSAIRTTIGGRHRRVNGEKSSEPEANPKSNAPVSEGFGGGRPVHSGGWANLTQPFS